MTEKEIKQKLKKTLKEFNKYLNTEKYAVSDKYGLDYLDVLISLSMRDDMGSFKDWKEGERRRQMNKKVSNKIGDFHEMMVSAFSDWERVVDLAKKDPKRHKKYKGLDIINEKKKIACEIKNKHNSINAGGLKQIARTLDNFKKKSKWETCLVIMLPKPGSNLAKKGSEENLIDIGDKKVNIKYMSGQEFYYLVTGDKGFYKKLITQIFPEVLKLNLEDKKEIASLYGKVYGISKKKK